MSPLVPSSWPVPSGIWETCRRRAAAPARALGRAFQSWEPLWGGLAGDEHLLKPSLGLQGGHGGLFWFKAPDLGILGSFVAVCEAF